MTYLDRLARWTAWKLPKSVVMWAAFRVGAHATQGPYSGQVVPDLTFLDAMRRWAISHTPAKEPTP